MKKFLALFLTLCLLVGSLSTLTACKKNKDDDDTPEHVHEYVDGSCSCGETDPNYTPSNPGTNPGTTPANSQVTSEQWTASFNFGTNYVITVETETNYGQTDTESASLARSGNLFKIDEFEYEDGSLLWHEVYYYDLTAGAGKEYEPKYDDNDELICYVIKSSPETIEMMEAQYMSEIIPDQFKDMSLYTYNATSGKYALTTPMVVYGATISTVEATFADAKLVSVYYVIEGDGYSMEREITLSYGNATVTLPTNVFDMTAEIGTSGVTAEEFENALSCFGENYTIEHKVIYSEGNYELYTYERDDNIIAHWDTEFENAVEVEDNQPQYFEYVDESWYTYFYDGSNYQKSNYGGPDISKFHAYLLEDEIGFMGSALSVFDYTYDATNGVFVRDNYEYSYSYGSSNYNFAIDATYSDIQIKISADGKLQKITYNLDATNTYWFDDPANTVTEDNVADMEVTVTYGSTQLELPTNVYDPADQIYMVEDAYRWEAVIDCEYEERFHFSSEYASVNGVEIDNNAVTGKDGNIIYVTSSDAEGNIGSEEYYDYENGEYFHYYKDNTTAGNWYREVITDTEYQTQLSMISYSAFLQYEKFAFDSTTKTYKQIEDVDLGPVVFKNCEVEIFEGRLVSITITQFAESANPGEENGITVTNKLVVDYSISYTLPTEFVDANA